MRHRTRNVLLVVEGEKEEPKLVESLFRVFNPDAKWRVYPYRTVIYDLLEKIERDYDGDYENVEIRNVLADMCPHDNLALHVLLDVTYTDIILMFDFDPQDNRFNHKALLKMMRAFNDSGDTDRGLLLMNYPSVESVKEAIALDYESYITSTVSVDQLSYYKEIVSNLASSTEDKGQKDFLKYSSMAFTKAIANSVGKLQHLIKDIQIDKTFPNTADTNLAEQCRELSQTEILAYQMNEYRGHRRVATCGTGTFFIALWQQSLDGAWKSCFGE